MNARLAAAAICICVSLLAFSLPARSAAPVSGPFEQNGNLPGGATYIVHRDQGSATTAVELWFRAPGAGYDLKNPGISRLAITAVAASSAPHGTSLAEFITRVGGTLSINVYPDIVMIGASVPSWQASALLRAMTSAYFAPSISEDGYKTALRDSAIAGAELQFDADRILQDALFEHLFVSGAAHYPPVPTSAQDYTKIDIDSVKSFAARAFRSQNAVLTVTGNVADNWTADVSGAGSEQDKDDKMDPPFDSTVAKSGTDVTQSASVSGLGFAWTGPSITDAKASTALDFIADYLFDSDHGTVAKSAREAGGDVFLNGQFITLHNPGVMIVTVAGTGAAQVRSKVLDAVTSVQQPMDQKTFDAARKAFEYHILSQLQTPQTRADNFGWYAAEGNLPYAPGENSGDYVKAAESLDPAYVAQIARQYLQHPAIVELTTGRRTQGAAS